LLFLDNCPVNQGLAVDGGHNVQNGFFAVGISMDQLLNGLSAETQIFRFYFLVCVSGFGGLAVSMLASGNQDRGFAPGRSRRIFPAGKIHSMPSFSGEVKQSVPCPSFGAC
jgi:hypothetical protein